MQRTIDRLAALPFGPDGAFERLVGSVYLPVVDWRKQTGYATAFAEAMANQRRSRAELDAMILRKLGRLVRSAATGSPYYRERFAAGGIDPAIRTLDDFRRLPLLTKATVATEGDRLANERHAGEARNAVTSGSTGLALRFRQSAEYEGWVDACFARGLSWWGVARSDRRILLWGRPIVGGRRALAQFWLKHRLRNGLAYNTFGDLTDAAFERVADAIETFRPRWIYGYGSSIGALATYLDRTGRALSPAARPAIVVYTSDHVFETEATIARRVFGAPLLSQYGASEAGSVAFLCPEGGMHVSEDQAHLEILRPDGTPTEPGEQGEIFITPMHNDAMPFLRYGIGDLGSFATEPCRCGLTLRTMNLEVGKVVDLVTTSTRERVNPISLDFASKHLLRTGVRGIRQFFIEQTGLDDFVLHVVREEPFDPRSTAFFVERMTADFGPSIRVEVRFVDEVPTSASGKRRWFKRSFLARAWAVQPVDHLGEAARLPALTEEPLAHPALGREGGRRVGRERRPQPLERGARLRAAEEAAVGVHERRGHRFLEARRDVDEERHLREREIEGAARHARDDEIGARHVVLEALLARAFEEWKRRAEAGERVGIVGGVRSPQEVDPGAEDVADDGPDAEELAVQGLERRGAGGGAEVAVHVVRHHQDPRDDPRGARGPTHPAR